MLSFSPRDVLDEILNLIESVSEGFPTYFYNTLMRTWQDKISYWDTDYVETSLNVLIYRGFSFSTHDMFYKIISNVTQQNGSMQNFCP